MRSLSAKLIAGLLATLAAAFLWLGYANLQLLRENLEQTAILSARRMADIIFRSTRQGMLENNREIVFNTIRSIGAQQGVEKVRVFDKAGVAQYSTLESERGHMVDQKAEACVACHASSKPLEKPEARQTYRIYRIGNRRVIGLIRPIENEAACSNASCHAHPATQRILGVLDVVLSLEAIDKSLARHEGQMQAQVVFSALAIMTITSVLIWMLIRRPIHRLIAGVHEFGAGNLSFRFGLRRRDELGELADAFDHMAEELDTANRTLEERIQKKTRELEAAQEKLIHSEKLASLGQLSAAVAHEINNPLAGIFTYAKLLQRKLAPPKPASDWIETIQSESRRCGDIVNNLLVFARKQNTELAPAEVRGIIERTLAVCRHKLEMNSIDLDVETGTETVVCDAMQIQQVLLAIIVNAVDALKSNGQGERRLRIRVVKPEKNWVDIVVANNGPAIPQDVMPHIFEPFFSTKQAASGVGLGLAVAYGIVKRHGGEIQVETGEETAFHVRLPIAPEMAQPAETEKKKDARGEVVHTHRG